MTVVSTNGPPRLAGSYRRGVCRGRNALARLYASSDLATALSFGSGGASDRRAFAARAMRELRAARPLGWRRCRVDARSAPATCRQGEDGATDVNGEPSTTEVPT